VYPVAGQQTTKPKNEDISDDIVPTYFNPTDGTTHASPPTDPSQEYYVLVPGTPATCAQLGIFHYNTLFPHNTKGPVDLVISGPNHGRNTSAAFALSSGTLCGALEAAICGVRAVAISFAFTTRKETDELVAEGSALSVKIVEKLVTDWTGGITDSPPDVYTINVPLVEGVGKHPVKWTWMLDNKWSKGSLYKAVEKNDDAAEDKAALDSVDKMRSKGDGDGSRGTEGEAKRKQPTTGLSFKWSPTFGDMWSTIQNSADGNDGRTVMEGATSVVPIRANFEGLYGRGRFTGEMKL